MKRFTIVNNGYNVDEVNRFIDVVIKRLEKLNSDNALMQMKISSLEEQLQKSKKEEVNLGEAIVAAQKTADRIKSLAREESNMIVEEARNNANAIVHEALLTAEKTEHEAMILRKNITVYKNRVKNIIKSQLEIADELDNIKEEPLFSDEAFESHVLYKFKKEQPFTITRDNDIYVVKGKEIEKLFHMTKFTDEGAIRFARKLRKMGIDDKLLEMGAKYGDKVQIEDLIFEFKE